MRHLEAQIHKKHLKTVEYDDIAKFMRLDDVATEDDIKLMMAMLNEKERDLIKREAVRKEIARLRDLDFNLTQEVKKFTAERIAEKLEIPVTEVRRCERKYLGGSRKSRLK